MDRAGTAMTTRVLLCVAAMVVAMAVVGRAFQARQRGGPERAALQPAQTSDNTVRDKVYTPDQAKAGKATYDAKCAGCHDGGAMGPELWGDPFLTSWDNKSVATFFERIRTTMPEDS